jgi:hypothetical protein
MRRRFLKKFNVQTVSLLLCYYLHLGSCPSGSGDEVENLKVYRQTDNGRLETSLELSAQVG